MFVFNINTQILRRSSRIRFRDTRVTVLHQNTRVRRDVSIDTSDEYLTCIKTKRRGEGIHGGNTLQGVARALFSFIETRLLFNISRAVFDEHLHHGRRR